VSGRRATGEDRSGSALVATVKAVTFEQVHIYLEGWGTFRCHRTSPGEYQGPSSACVPRRPRAVN